MLVINYLDYITKTDEKLDIKEILIENEELDEKSFSKKMTKLITKEENDSIKLGLDMHYALEVTDFINPNFDNMDNFQNASIEELTNIQDIGDIIARSIVEFFSSASTKETIKVLKELGVNMNYTGEKVEEQEEFSGKTFVLTGSLELFTRDEAEEKIELLGGKTSGSVSKKTSVVIVGANPGSKYNKALDLGITIWTEEEFKEKLEEIENNE